MTRCITVILTWQQTLNVICLLALLISTGCNNDEQQEAEPVQEATTGQRQFSWFVEEALQRGLDFTYQADATPACRMPEIIGGGAALLDVDGDGDLDLYCVQGGSLKAELRQDNLANAMFLNDGNGVFQRREQRDDASDKGYGMGVAAGDVDNDGDVDLYVTNLGANILLLNDGAGTFVQAPTNKVVAGNEWSVSAAFADVNNDGNLDLFVCNYLDWSPEVALECFNTKGGVDYCSPRNFMAPTVDRLYLNQGGGAFVDATIESGVAKSSGHGLGVICLDANDDGWIDLFIANDGTPDALWMNQGDGRFVNEADTRGCALDRDGRSAAGMGVAAGDVDHDGDEDLIVCNMRNESDSLFLNESGRHFSNATARVGLAAASRIYTRFGQGLFDFNNDGWLDLFQANGRVMRQHDEPNPNDPYAEKNMLFKGGAQRFTVVDDAQFTKRPHINTSRGACFGDINGDGAMDVVIVNRDGPLTAFVNTVEQRGNWLKLDCRLSTGRAAIGTRIIVRDQDEIVYSGMVRRASSYASSNDPVVHIGLGERTGPFQLELRWPGHQSAAFRTLNERNAVVTIHEQPKSDADES